jgi:multidrug efflux pump
LLFMILLSGLLARCSIPVEGDPDISVPFFVITVVHEGISPEDAERLLVMPLEVELRQVGGIEEINAYASENAGTVMVEVRSGLRPRSSADGHPRSGRPGKG